VARGDTAAHAVVELVGGVMKIKILVDAIVDGDRCGTDDERGRTI
jgi:hypothetical protein